MKLNYVLSLLTFHAEVHRAQGRQEDTHVLRVLIFVVLQLYFEAVYTDLMVEVNKIGEWMFVDFNLRKTSFHEPVEIAHLIEVLFDELF